MARKGFFNDKCAMDWADTCVLVLPSGRSAHTEAGVMKGEGKEVIVFTPLKQEPELMYKLFDGIISNAKDLRSYFHISDKQEGGSGD